MIKEPTVLGVYIGIACCIPYIVIHVLRKNPPKFNHIAVIILSCVGGVVGINFGYIVLNADLQYLGNLKDHRLPMILGSLAVVWTSIESIVKIYYQLALGTSTKSSPSVEPSEETPTGWLQ